jgi:hypothetical protein
LILTCGSGFVNCVGRLPTPIPIRARDQRQPQIEIRRWHYRGDLRLPVVEISVRLAA